LADLLSAGLVNIGQTIYPNTPTLQEHLGKILSDGRIDVGGQIFDTPSGAGLHLRKRATNGWGFWLVDRKTKKSLKSVRREYLESIALESDVSDEELMKDDAESAA
jgi:hypothetical protein